MLSVWGYKRMDVQTEIEQGNIPVYDEDNTVILTVPFKDNLTRKGVPDYVNMNCLQGIRRLDYTYKTWEGWYVLMYYDIQYPSHSYGELLTEEEALEELTKRDRLDLLEHYVREVEVI